MAVEGSQPLKISRPAGADESANQYLVMKDDGSGNAVLVTAATSTPLGILQNKPKNRALGLSGQSPTGNATEMAELVVVGRTKAVAAGSINPGAPISFNSSGQVQAATLTGYGTAYVQGTKQAIGYLDQAAAASANDVCTVVINCLNPVPAT